MNYKGGFNSIANNRSNNPMIGNTGLGNVNSNINESELEIEFGYCTEEESVFQSFNQDVERNLPRLKKHYSLKNENKHTTHMVKDMIKRFTEKSNTYEFLVKFKVEMENSNENSSVYSAQGTPLGMIDDKEKKKFLKNEIKSSQQNQMFGKEVSEKDLINYLLELIIKANAILDLVSANDNLKLFEMSINKNDILLEKSKLVIIKIDKLYMAIPLTMAKIEVKMRNIVINEKPKLEGLVRFINFYL